MNLNVLKKLVDSKKSIVQITTMEKSIKLYILFEGLYITICMKYSVFVMLLIVFGVRVLHSIYSIRIDSYSNYEFLNTTNFRKF